MYGGLDGLLFVTSSRYCARILKIIRTKKVKLRRAGVPLTLERKWEHHVASQAAHAHPASGCSLGNAGERRILLSDLTVSPMLLRVAKPHSSACTVRAPGRGPASTVGVWPG